MVMAGGRVMAAPELNKRTPEMDHEFVWNLAMAAVEVFYGQCEISAQPAEPTKFSPDPSAGKAINAAVDIRGPGIAAVLQLSIPEGRNVFLS
jgi:hypothetical protein